MLSHRGLMIKVTKSFKIVPEWPSSPTEVNVGHITFQGDNSLILCSGHFVVLFMKWWQYIWPCILSLGALAIVKQLARPTLHFGPVPLFVSTLHNQEKQKRLHRIHTIKVRQTLLLYTHPPFSWATHLFCLVSPYFAACALPQTHDLRMQFGGSHTCYFWVKNPLTVHVCVSRLRTCC